MRDGVKHAVALLAIQVSICSKRPSPYLPFTSGKISPDGCALSERTVTVAFW
jgi:hypothetical protein